MRSSAGIAIICGLTFSILAIIAVAGSRGGADKDCASCHSPVSPEGGFTFERPGLSVIAPDDIEVGDIFQVLVLLTEPIEYDLVAPTAGIDVSGMPGSEVVGSGNIDLLMNGSAWKGVFRVRANSDGGMISISAVYLAYFDHVKDENPDLAPYQESRKVDVKVQNDGVPNVDRTNDSPLGGILFLLGPSTLTWWRLWRGRRDRVR